MGSEEEALASLSPFTALSMDAGLITFNPVELVDGGGALDVFENGNLDSTEPVLTLLSSEYPDTGGGTGSDCDEKKDDSLGGGWTGATTLGTETAKRITKYEQQNKRMIIYTTNRHRLREAGLNCPLQVLAKRQEELGRRKRWKRQDQ